MRYPVKIGKWQIDLGSCTLWFNTVCIPAFIYAMQDPDFMKLIGKEPRLSEFLVTIYSLVNIFLRFKSKTPLASPIEVVPVEAEEPATETKKR